MKKSYLNSIFLVMIKKDNKYYYYLCDFDNESLKLKDIFNGELYNFDDIKNMEPLCSYLNEEHKIYTLSELFNILIDINIQNNYKNHYKETENELHI